MKLSELIEELNEALLTHGNLPGAIQDTNLYNVGGVYPISNNWGAVDPDTEINSILIGREPPIPRSGKNIKLTLC